MKMRFNPDGPIFRSLSFVADLVILHFLCLICCIPVFTIGAAMTALARVTQDMVRLQEPGVGRTFFRAFRENFRQSTVCWLVCLAVGVVVVLDFLLINDVLTGTAQSVGFLLWVLVTVVYLGVMAWLFPLLARYEGTLGQHLKNALILALAKLPRTLIMVAVHALPFVLLLFPVVLSKVIIFLAVCGFGLSGYLDARLIAPVFRNLEGDTGENGEREEPEGE